MKEPCDSVLRPGLALVELFLLQNIFLEGKNFSMKVSLLGQKPLISSSSPIFNFLIYTVETEEYTRVCCVVLAGF